VQLVIIIIKLPIASMPSATGLVVQWLTPHAILCCCVLHIQRLECAYVWHRDDESYAEVVQAYEHTAGA
jgi:hypothetical protein